MASQAHQQSQSQSQRAHAVRPLALARWLYIVAALVVVIVAVGGITRLTESGLSITHWSVVTGILPPLTEAAWQAEFDLYRKTRAWVAEKQVRSPGPKSDGTTPRSR